MLTSQGGRAWERPGAGPPGFHSASVSSASLISSMTSPYQNRVWSRRGWEKEGKADGFVVVQSPSRVRLFVTPWTAACQASLSIIISQSLLKLMSIELVTPSNHLILCCPLLPLPSVFPSIRVFSSEVGCSHQVDKVLELQLQHQFFQ